MKSWLFTLPRGIMTAVVKRSPIILTIWIVLLLIAGQLSACTYQVEPTSPDSSVTPTDPQVEERPSPTAFLPLPSTEAPSIMKLWVAPSVPPPLLISVQNLDQFLGTPVEFVDEVGEADIRIGPDAEVPITEWIYALVAPFPTLEDGMDYTELLRMWIRGEASTRTMILSPSTKAAMVWVLGTQAPEFIQDKPEGEILASAWEAQPSISIVPFDDLEPRWKVLEIEGNSPIRPEFDSSTYPLVLQFGLSGPSELIEPLREILDWPGSNRDPSRMTILVLTGTTALTRTVSWRMDQKGLEYPGEQIRSWLAEADLAHISHEVSFSETCPDPDPFQSMLQFCSSPRHFALLEYIGADLIEVTGNHVMDWGPRAFLDTLRIYTEAGMAYFGGGPTLETAIQPVKIEHNGNRLAFLGCNAAGPSHALATDTLPGAMPCSSDELFTQMASLLAEGYLPIFTFQWPEGAVTLPAQRAAFQNAVDQGAVIVSGSQAHQALGIEFYQGGFIHYGLGNLFFDQMQSLAFRQEFLDRHVFYDGKYISTELLTALLEDFAQPRPMAADERKVFLENIFRLSGW